jgi:hypothetical protein
MVRSRFLWGTTSGAKEGSSAPGSPAVRHGKKGTRAFGTANGLMEDVPTDRQMMSGTKCVPEQKLKTRPK